MDPKVYTGILRGLYEGPYEGFCRDQKIVCASALPWFRAQGQDGGFGVWGVGLGVTVSV